MSASFDREVKMEALVAKAGGSCACGHAWTQHGESGGCGAKNGHDEYCYCQTTPPALKEFLHEERRMRALLYPCKEHPRYQVKRKPTCLCEKCWRMWIAVHP